MMTGNKKGSGSTGDSQPKWTKISSMIFKREVDVPIVQLSSDSDPEQATLNMNVVNMGEVLQETYHHEDEEGGDVVEPDPLLQGSTEVQPVFKLERGVTIENCVDEEDNSENNDEQIQGGMTCRGGWESDNETYVTFFDPVNLELEDQCENSNNPDNDDEGIDIKYEIGTREVPSPSQEYREPSPEPELAASSSSSPRPSTSKGATGIMKTGSVKPVKRKAKEREHNKKRKRVRFSNMGNRRKKRMQLNSDSSGSNDEAEADKASSSSESLFEAVVVKRKRKVKKVNKKGRRKRIRRSERTVKVNDKEKKRMEAMEALLQKREKLAEKSKQKPPAESEDPKKDTEDAGSESDSSSSGSYASGSSPPFVVSGSSTAESDFDGSSATPSSSSVTSAGETDEELDLEIGGSEGEELLKPEEKADVVDDDDDDEEEDAKSYTSSDEEAVENQGVDMTCILCTNLGDVNVTGRATVAPDPNLWCRCGGCRVFSPFIGDYDLVCCRDLINVVEFLQEELDESDVCITKHPRFQQDVLENEGYTRSISKHRDPRRFSGYYWGNYYERYTSGKADYRLAESAKHRFQRSTRFQKMGYSFSSYTHWIFDKLGKDARQIVIPACVQNVVRQAFNIPQLACNPFQSRYICPNAKHCRLAFC